MNTIKINSLWSLENIKDQYVFDTDTFEVLNTLSNKALKVQIDKRGYPVVYLQRKRPSKSGRMSANIKYHKIIALSIINNGPYELIEHLDDNPLNFNPDNLKFSNQSSNARTMLSNGIIPHKDAIFELCMENGKTYTGSIKKISKESGIPRGTLYDRFYAHQITFKSKRRKHKIKYICELDPGNSRTKKVPHAKYKDQLARDSDGFLALVHKNKLNRSTD